MTPGIYRCILASLQVVLSVRNPFFLNCENSCFDFGRQEKEDSVEGGAEGKGKLLVMGLGKGETRERASMGMMMRKQARAKTSTPTLAH